MRHSMHPQLAKNLGLEVYQGRMVLAISLHGHASMTRYCDLSDGFEWADVTEMGDEIESHRAIRVVQSRAYFGEMEYGYGEDED